jgi:hypothetical protein
VASVVNSLGTSTNCDGGAGYWLDTAILVTWDDWGGFYDHEPPPILSQPQGDYQYGFRVPLVVISARTPAGYVSNNHHDFGSILRFIEGNFGITETLRREFHPQLRQLWASNKNLDEFARHRCAPWFNKHPDERALASATFTNEQFRQIGIECISENWQRGHL